MGGVIVLGLSRCVVHFSNSRTKWVMDMFPLLVAAVYNKEEDIATYTIKSVDDPRTLNKILYIRPVANTISMNDLTTLWENKIGKKLKRVYVPEEQVLKDIQGENTGFAS